MTVSPTRLLILIVGLVLILNVAGIVALAVLQHPVPDVMQNVTLASLTGLLGLLVPAKHEADQ